MALFTRAPGDVARAMRSRKRRGAARAPRLSMQEMEILLAACSYLFAGETDGTCLEGETERETNRNIRHLGAAQHKLNDMLMVREAAAARRRNAAKGVP
jgi:hypothetical protein